MAKQILYVFSLCVLLCAVYSSPVSAHDSKSMQSSDSVRDTKLVQSLYNGNSLDAGVVPNVDVNSVKSFRRVKRGVIVSHGCPTGTIWFANQCVTYEK